MSLVKILTAFVLCLSGTENCSSKDVTADTETSSNDNLSVNSVSGNKVSGGGRWTRALADGAISDQDSMAGKWFQK